MVVKIVKKTTKVSISSLSAFVAHVEKHCSGETVLFRGQREDKPLLPKIARLKIEGSVLDAEQRMFDDFKRQAIPHLDHTPESDWDWLALAQHFGMATRLLDWSTNPLAALWFAVQRPPRPPSPGIGPGPGVMWYFEARHKDFHDASGNADPFSLDRTRVFRPRHITRRIIAQSGYFTCHKYVESSQKKYISLDRNASYTGRLTKLEIPVSAFADLRRDLDRFGINAAALYGGLDGVCSHIEWLHSYFEDESPAGHPKNTSPESST